MTSNATPLHLSAVLPAWDLRRLPLFVFVASALALLMRTLLIPEPVLMGDEYYYTRISKLWHEGQQWTQVVTPMPSRGEVRLPNDLFFFVYRLAHAFGDNFYVVGKVLGIALATLAALAAIRTARLYVDAATAWLVGALVLWLPASSYYTYFMPEALYDLLIWCGIAAFLGHCAGAPLRAAALLGAWLGAALLAKPNAVALLAAANITVVMTTCAPLRAGWRLRAGAMLALNAAFLTAAFALHVATTGHLSWDPVGGFYRDGLSKFGEIGHEQGHLRQVAKYTLVYLLVLGMVLGPALVVIVRRARSGTLDVADRALAVLSVTGLALLLAGSVKVGVTWERTLPEHVGVYSTRYMAVLFPLLVIAFVRFAPVLTPASRRVGRIAALLLAAGVAVLALVYAGGSNPLQMRELFWSGLDWKGPNRALYAAQTLLFLSATLHAGFAAQPRAAPYLALLGMLGVVASLHVLRADMVEAARGSAARYAEAARVVRALVRPDLRDHGIVVATRPSYGAHFMLRYPETLPLVTAPAGAQVAAYVMPEGRLWAVHLGETVDGQAHGCIAMVNAALCVARPDVLFHAAPSVGVGP